MQEPAPLAQAHSGPATSPLATGTPLLVAVAHRLSAVLGPAIGIALVLIIFGIWSPDRFLSERNFTNILRSNYHVAVAAVGATFVIISGGIDLSVGSNIAFSSVCCALVLKGMQLPRYDAEQGLALGIAVALITVLCALGRRLQAGQALLPASLTAIGIAGSIAVPAWLVWWFLAERSLGPQPVWVGIAVGICAGAAVGMLNGLLVTSISLPPFIVTLATLGAVRGLTLYMTNGLTVSEFPRQIGDLLNRTLILQLPINVWIALALIVLAAPVLHLTVLGRYVYAIGSNERTARLCGVRVERYKIICYTIAGATAGLAGVMMAATFVTAIPSEFRGAELDVIAAVVIGGTSLFGGEGTIAGSALGVLMLNTLYSGCNIVGISSYIQQIFIGGTIVLAAALDRFRHLRR